MTWEVRLVDYCTYADIDRRGNILPALVEYGLTPERAVARANELGFGHGAFESPPERAG